jgi:hypothetical protein
MLAKPMSKLSTAESLWERQVWLALWDSRASMQNGDATEPATWGAADSRQQMTFNGSDDRWSLHKKAEWKVFLQRDKGDRVSHLRCSIGWLSTAETL